MADPFTHFHQIKNALAAAGLHADALAMDGVVNAGFSFEQAWDFVGHWRERVRNRQYLDALATAKHCDNNSKCAADLLYDLNRYAERQYGIDCRSGVAPVGKNAALFVILNGDGGKVLAFDSYRKKFAKIQVGTTAPLPVPTQPSRMAS